MHASAYLRRRAEGELHDFSLTSLAATSKSDYANDLAYFLNTFQEAPSAVLQLHAAEQKLHTRYKRHLEGADAALSASTISRRRFIAREYTDFLTQELGAGTTTATQVSEAIDRALVNDSNVQVSYFASAHVPGTRRRSPKTIQILPPDMLRTFLRSFPDPMHSAAAKTIYSTGSSVGDRRSHSQADH